MFMDERKIKMILPEELERMVTQDIHAVHVETEQSVWFRKTTMWLDPEYSVLKYWFPDDQIEHEGIVYSCGAAQINGKWILGWLSPELFFHPL